MNVGLCAGPVCGALQTADNLGSKLPDLPDPQKVLKSYLCGSSQFNNIKNYTLEGLGKGAVVGGIAGWEGGPPGVALGALDGGVEGFFSGNALGWVAASVCKAAGMYGPTS